MGIHLDCFGFKIPYLVVVINQLVVSSTFYFSARNKYFYFAANLLEIVTFSGYGTIDPPLITQIFGMKNAIILIGLTDYLIVYLIGAGFSCIALIIAIFMNGDKFPYKIEHSRITISSVFNEPLIKVEDEPKPEASKEEV